MARRREAETLRRELDAVPVRRGTCFPQDLKERAGRYIAERRAEGHTVDVIAAELGLAPGTVLRWTGWTATDQRGRSGGNQLLPVKVVPEQSVRTVSIVSPDGFRIEGLSLTEAAALLRALG